MSGARHDQRDRVLDDNLELRRLAPPRRTFERDGGGGRHRHRDWHDHRPSFISPVDPATWSRSLTARRFRAHDRRLRGLLDIDEPLACLRWPVYQWTRNLRSVPAVDHACSRVLRRPTRPSDGVLRTWRRLRRRYRTIRPRRDRRPSRITHGDAHRSRLRTARNRRRRNHTPATPRTCRTRPRHRWCRRNDCLTANLSAQLYV